jgi:hypothetical protein
MKYCPRCGIEKPATTQYWYADKKRLDGLQGYCKLCKSEIHKNYISNQYIGERVRKKIREWQKGIGKEKYKLSRKKFDSSLKKKLWRHKRTEKAKEFASKYVNEILKI